ncbi:helix-turn-helix domain-containing protein [Dysgonomonas sp. 520]|uniref:helix-turn-helix domain-containing protein n=1 Tax=Dysgonomonas sp. 520 TaxID=2302931 RepID=UPI0013D85EA6|nr:helix-turn-helix domain-containing protein [Dysgonomonas sp. 520]NDW08670.1 AraC family transcriptional regulator [Dysgonomonas sp. 520]
MKDNDKNESALIRFLNFEKGSDWETKEGESRIIVVTKGRLGISSNMQNSLTVSESRLFFLPAGDHLSARVLEKSSVIVINLIDSVHLETLNISSICEQKPDISCLKMESVLHAYVRSLQMYEESGISSEVLYTLKIRELICILKMSYSNEELTDFFRSHLSNDFHFSEQVRKLSQNTLNVRLLAEKMNYSYSGFNKRFRKTFGMSAYSWLRQRRTNTVYYEIYYTNKTLKQISTDHKFATLSHFNEFCHKNLGKAPSEIRRKRRQESSHKKEPLSLSQ